MAEHDYVIANQNGANTRSDLNNALAAIVSNNSKATAPTTTYAFMWWADTANDILKQRNAADSAWISILTLSTGAPLADYADNALSGNAIDGGTISNFTSTGIDDNATSTAITIDASENVGIGEGSPDCKLHITDTISNNKTFKVENTNATYANTMVHVYSAAPASTSYHYEQWRTASDNEFRFLGDGNAFCDGSWSGGGADYAEYFEWSDGNILDEDRRGISVVLDNEKIRPAVEGETPIGVISDNPSVVGDTAWNKWIGKYLRDDFGAYILEEYTVTEWEEDVVSEDNSVSTKTKSFESDKIPSSESVPSDATVKSEDDNGKTLERRTFNPDYDESTEYVARKDRQEWDTVGIMGKLRVIKGQPVDSRWIKMRDVSDTVEEWLVR
mgnify:CR=1 FL=1